MALDTENTPAPDDQFHGIDQYLGSPEFQRMIRDEFPEDAPEWLDPVTRRQFVTLMGASLALAGVAGCNPSLKPASERKIVPYVKKPEPLTPGVPLFFPTAMTLGGIGLGVLVQSREGRPIKVEGNPSHPASRGATDRYAQASVLGLYDPDRSKQVARRNEQRNIPEPSSWDKAKGELAKLIDAQKAKRGAGLRVLSEATTSPTLAALMGELKAILPDMKWVQYEPAGRENATRGGRLAFGKYVNPIYDFTKADVVLAIDSDVLSATGAADVKYTRDIMSRRKVRLSHDKKPGDGVGLGALSRIYAVEGTLTNTGGVADHRLPLKPTEVESFVRELAKELGVAGVPAAGPLPDRAKLWLKPLADDLRERKGNAAVIAGDTLSAAGHALVHAINHKLGAVGKTVTYTDPVQVGLTGPDADAVADGTASLKALVAEMAGGAVETILIFGGNPVFNAPADLDFTGALKKVQNKVHVGLYQDETAILCDWHVNAAHELEAWGDVRSFDGTATVQQPLIAPLFGGKALIEIVAALVNREVRDPYLLVRETWRKHHASAKSADGFDVFWHKAVERGVVEGTAFPATQVAEPKVADEVRNAPAPTTTKDEIELTLRPDPTLYDGRFANNGWLQELPKPGTRITWDNYAMVSPATADKLGCTVAFPYTGGEHGRAEVDMIELKVGKNALKVAVWIQPGHPDDVITLNFGYGRELTGKVGTGTGFNAYILRTTENPWVATGIRPGQSAVRTGTKYFLACTQGQHAMEGRRPARWGTVDQVKAQRGEFDRHQLHAFDFADNPPVAAAEKDLIRENVPGTPEERERLAEQYPGKFVNALHTHEGEAGEKGHHEHEHDKRLVPLSLIPDIEVNKLYRRWGMTIDLGACTGCTACVIACQAENNIPVLGKHEVTRGRIMHWIRVDRYFAAPPEKGGTEKVTPDERWESLKRATYDVTVHFQPVPCQQCEKAPCELVCPVNATVHSSDGLNDMVYNRCVGTRYCANNCPYKVRRFNFLQYANYSENTLNLVNNPEVTVRTRGVMEKCTYCVQRIRVAEVEAEREHNNPARPLVQTPLGVRPLILEGEVKTACQAACPAHAITFGDLNYDQYVPVKKNAAGEYAPAGSRLPLSEVARWKLEPTNYGLLSELNTMPRTSYLAAVKNPNEKLVAAIGAAKPA